VVIQQYLGHIPKTQEKTISFSRPDASAKIKEHHIEFSDGTFDLTTAPIQGPHNAINMSAAILAAEAVGIPLSDIKTYMASFQNAPHRLEPCGDWNGISFVNDSKATNVDAVFYALNSFKKPIILIMGGVDKGNEYEVLDELVKEKVKAFICLGKDNSKLENHFGPICPKIFSTDELETAIKKGMEWGVSGDVVLLSPACASFDLFKNYEDRGDQFKKAVKQLCHGN